eukprot:2522800-Pleurochrysis_carterae.AAC.1
MPGPRLVRSLTWARAATERCNDTGDEDVEVRRVSCSVARCPCFATLDSAYLRGVQGVLTHQVGEGRKRCAQSG